MRQKNPIIATMKSELKELAAFIREIRNAALKVEGQSRYEHHVNANYYGSTFRVKHIAYCLLRGRTLEQIENTHKPGAENTYEYKRCIINAKQLVAQMEEEIACWRESLQEVADGE
jgi:hypothetical protein